MPCARARSRSPRPLARRSRRSKGCTPRASTRCRSRGSPSRCPSAAIASRGRSCRPPRSSPRTRRRPTRTSTPPWRATSAAARPTCASGARSSAPPRGCDMARRIDRRDFIKTTTVAGVGLTLSFTLPGVGVRTAAALSAWEPNTHMTLTPDGLVTVHIFKAEMGQGVGTALAQIVAEELEVDWKDIRIDYPTSDPKHGLMITGGSWSVNWTFDKLSRAAVAARTMLIAAAAQQWKVPASECVAERSTVRHAPTGRFLTYGQIVDKVPIAARTWSEDDLKKLTLKKPEEYRVVGHWAARLDIPEKVNGKAKFGIDTFLPGMVYAKVAYPPTREGAKVKAVDDKAAKGVKGDVKGALGKASKTHEATYVTDYVAHAPLEPMNCVAKFEGGVADIYTGCQFQTMAMGAISKQLGIKEDKVRVHQHYLGGGFGR